MISLIILTQTSKIIWLNYPATGCVTCHRIASVKMSDTLFVIGSFHQTTHSTPLLIAVDSALNIKWYKAFEHNLSNLRIDKMVKVNDSLIAISGGHSNQDNQCPNRNCTFFGIFNIKTQNFVWAKYRVSGTSGGHGHPPIPTLTFDGNNLILGGQSRGDGSSSWVVKTNLNGGVLWQKFISLSGCVFFIMDIESDGSNYISANFTECSGYHKLNLLKLDQNGNMVWSKQYDFGYHNYPYRLLKDIDGYIVI